MSGNGAIYIYYQVPQDRVAAVRRAAMVLLSEIKATVGISGQLLRRRDDPSTWMEIYERIADLEHVEAELQRAADRHDFNALLAPSRRHTEVFVADVLEPASGQGDTLCA